MEPGFNVKNCLCLSSVGLSWAPGPASCGSSILGWVITESGWAGLFQGIADFPVDPKVQAF